MYAMHQIVWEGGRLDVEHGSTTSIDRSGLTKAVQAPLRPEFESRLRPSAYKAPYSSHYKSRGFFSTTSKTMPGLLLYIAF
jgi:hypothetical protein